MYYEIVYDMLVNVNVNIMYMYVNKRVELAQRGIALQKIYVLLLLLVRGRHCSGREPEV